MDIPVLFADDQVVVCVKPAGISSEEDGMVRALKAQLGGDIFCVHRLDREVTGVMVYARTSAAAAKLSADGLIRKEYRAVVHGKPDSASGTLRDLLYHNASKNKSYPVKKMRRGVKEAVLDYEVLQSVDAPCGQVSLIRIMLHTGRTHQIRVQFASRKMPLVGDARYGSPEKKQPIALYAKQLSFVHPKTRKAMTFTVDAPEGAAFTLFQADHV